MFVSNINGFRHIKLNKSILFIGSRKRNLVFSISNLRIVTRNNNYLKAVIGDSKLFPLGKFVDSLPPHY